ncbi:LCP family protein [Natribacillus halophilus]|uniref:Cell envelope-related function transcriptional attenuator common domain-containing protein n=1 Tax=Natribacillus halophilus TaxID=549003 RepID=A0A1G8KPB8_9BACI|nr:LCP family protein [Natribacillus halophilus]SDI45258.1 cell envelope-related function transcriptional attenuator common domain-containing protein [Natribacillus halophilus]
MAKKNSSQQSSRSFKHHRKKRRNKKIIFSLVALVLFVVASAGALLFYFFTQAGGLVGETQDPLERGEVSERRDQAVNPADDHISVLFLGTDNRDGELDGLADAILLATFNAEEDSVNVVSIPRDSYVEIPGHPTDDKINHAHAFGGADMMVNTVENLLDVPVDYYVTLNFDAFMDTVDIFDGIDVNSPMSFTEQDADGNMDEISIDEGPQTLNGEEALAYVRMRMQDPDGDLGRGERQQEVLGSLIDEATNLSSIGNYNQVFDRLQENMRMNISFNEITGLHSYAGSIDDINYHQLEGESFRESGVDYHRVYDSSLEDTQAMLKQHLDLEDDTSPDTTESINAGENSEENH